MGEGPNDAGVSRYHLMHQIDASLNRLGLDHVDLYQIHGWDSQTPMEEALRALDDIVRSGRARYVGVSNWAAWQIMKALGISERLGLEKFASLQAYYTVAGRDLEREIVPMLQSEGVGLMVWSPLAGGLLSGKYTRGDDDKSEGEGRRAAFDFPPVEMDRAYDLIDLMQGIAQAKGKTVAQIALAWLLHRPVVSTVIVGAKRADQLADNIGACDVEFTKDEWEQLDKASRLPREYPGWMLGFQGSYRDDKVSARRTVQ
jgi:aryl-alcohol dehydrogenase-like predicted oxidoreductase